MNTIEIYACKYCKDTALIQDDNSISTCPHCIKIQHFMEALTLSINRSHKSGDMEMAEKLTNISFHLPKYSVMAYLEALACNMNPEFTKLLEQAFDLRLLS